MASETRKPVIFNKDVPRDRVLLEVAQKHIPNFTSWVKKNLEGVAKAYGVTVPKKDDGSTPQPARGTEPRQPEK